MSDTITNTIQTAIAASRRKRAAGTAVVNDAIYLAKDTETALGDLAGICGADSPQMTEAATAVASEMLNVVITALNRGSADPRHDLADARKALTYISRLPLTQEFKESRLAPQRALIVERMRRHNVPDRDADINFAPTVGDDACFAACATASDYSAYLRRHPHGRHADEANGAIRRLDAARRRRQSLTKMAVRLSGVLLAVLLLTAVCLVMGVNTGVTVGLALLLVGGALGVMFVRSFGKDAGVTSRQRYITGSVATVLIIAGTGLILTTERRAQRAALDDILAHSDEEALEAYLCDPSNTYYADDALQAYLALMDSVFFDPERMAKPSQLPPLARMAMLAKAEDLPEATRKVLEERVKLRTDSLYRLSLAANDLDSWLSYQALAPGDLYYDSSERIDSIETVNWSSEPTAWASATRENTRDGYSRYLESFPAGAHATEANARLIDLEVSDYRNQGQVTVESISRIAEFPGPGSRVCIYNNSDYDVKFMFSGPASASYTVKAGEYDERDFADGSYQVLALIDNPRRDRFSFTQQLDHGIYSSTIEITDKSPDNP